MIWFATENVLNRYSVTMLSVALHNLRSLYNVGSVFRTASGAGFDHIYLSGYTGSPPHSRIAKVALGAEMEVPFSCYSNLDSLLSALENHYTVILERDSGAQLFSEIIPPDNLPVTLVLGEELFGVSSPLLQRADVIAEIPMAGKKGSLNVASAFAIVAYDLAAKLGKVGSAQLSVNRPADTPRGGVLTRRST